MNDEKLQLIYEYLVDQAFMTIDLKPYWCCTVPFILCRIELTCDDGVMAMVYLVDDWGMLDEGHDIYLWVKFEEEDMFIEFPLCRDYDKVNNWWALMQDEKVETRALEILGEIVSGGKEYMTSHLEEDGMTWEFALAITDERMDNIVKLPSSCAVSVHGQVFHGIKDIEKYCHEQRNDSSPYILKRCFELPYMEQDDMDWDQRFARNYLLCRNKDEAECFMKTFIGIKDVSALKPDKIPTPADFPPLICYVDPSRYMLLSYREGFDE